MLSLQLGLQAQTPLRREERPGEGTRGSPVPCRAFLRVLQRAPFADVQLAELLPWEAPRPCTGGGSVDTHASVYWSGVEK